MRRLLPHTEAFIVGLRIIRRRYPDLRSVETSNQSCGDICPTRSEAALVSKPNASESIRHPCPNDPARLSTFRLLYANVPLLVQACCLVQARPSLSWRTVAAAFRLSGHSQSISSRSFPLPAPCLLLSRNNPTKSVFGQTNRESAIKRALVSAAIDPSPTLLTVYPAMGTESGPGLRG
jgi:hypothetical protein